MPPIVFSFFMDTTLFQRSKKTFIEAAEPSFLCHE
jgi:hypothetical protein